MFGTTNGKNKRDFYYPLEMKIYRESLIKEKLNNEGKLSNQDYDYLLRGISMDVYDSIDNLKEWHSFSIKGTFCAYASLGVFIPRYRNIRDLIKKGFESETLAFDNYRKVLNGLDVANNTRSLNDIKVLIEQLYNAEVYADNYDDYMNNLMARNLTKYLDGDYNYNYLIEMKDRRERVLELEKKYTLKK